MKSSGYYRLLATYPTPSLVLFSDEESTPYFVQSVGKDQTVHSFEQLPDIDPSRVIIKGGPPTVESAVGSQAQLAVALSADHVIVGTADVLQETLRQYIDKNAEAIKPFDLLEFAIFIRDENLVKRAAAACKLLLEMTAPSLVGRWIEGAPLSKQVKAYLRSSSQGESKTRGTGSRPARIRLGFAGPYSCMKALTTYSEIAGTTRAALVRQLFSGEGVRERVRSLGPKIGSTTAAIRNALVSAGKYRGKYYWMDSRGAVYLTIENLPDYMTAREEFRVAMYENRVKEYIHLPAVGYGEEAVSFLMICCYFADEFPEFEAYLSEAIPVGGPVDAA